MKHDTELLSRIDTVIRDNRRTEYLYITLTTVLFLLGIASAVSALCTGQYVWASPSMITTYLLRYPLNEIKSIRSKNIALAVVPALIAKLPKAEAAKEIQKLIENLYGGKK